MSSDLTFSHAGGVVYRGDAADRRVLLVRSRMVPHEWVLPKGHIERGETPEDTARREVREEAGVDAEPLRYAGTLEFTTPYGKQVRAAYFVMRFLRTVTPEEHREINWATVDEALALVNFDDTRALIRSAFSST